MTGAWNESAGVQVGPGRAVAAGAALAAAAAFAATARRRVVARAAVAGRNARSGVGRFRIERAARRDAGHEREDRSHRTCRRVRVRPHGRKHTISAPQSAVTHPAT